MAFVHYTQSDRMILFHNCEKCVDVIILESSDSAESECEGDDGNRHIYERKIDIDFKVYESETELEENAGPSRTSSYDESTIKNR